MSTAVILQIVAGLVGLASLWLREYYGQSHQEEKKNEKIEEGRAAVVAGDVASVQSRLDRLLREPTGSSGAAGSKSTEDINRRIRNL